MKHLTLTLISLCFAAMLRSQAPEATLSFAAPNATQAIAADSLHFFTISNYRILKRRKTDGEIVARWEGEKNGPIAHLNSGIILDGILYCANSNYPQLPMWSSLEMYDPETLAHIGSHSFGIFIGSLTWVDRFDGHWWAMFVHYDPEVGYPDKSVAWTQLLRFNESWQPTAAYVLPDSLIDHIRPMSISGGYFLKDGRMVCSPHHFEELYILALPRQGSALRWTQTVPAPFQGQGIAPDPVDTGLIWGIHRKNREAKAWYLPE